LEPSGNDRSFDSKASRRSGKDGWTTVRPEKEEENEREEKKNVIKNFENGSKIYFIYIYLYFKRKEMKMKYK
jgi:hypothetical protein